jgi:hypothetical protein
VDEFPRSDSSLEVDGLREKFFMTFSPCSYLRKR